LSIAYMTSKVLKNVVRWLQLKDIWLVWNWCLSTTYHIKRDIKLMTRDVAVPMHVYIVSASQCCYTPVDNNTSNQKDFLKYVFAKHICMCCKCHFHTEAYISDVILYVTRFIYLTHNLQTNTLYLQFSVFLFPVWIYTFIYNVS